MPGAITPPRYSPASEIASKVVAVPKSTTMQGLAVAPVRRHRVGDAVGAQLVGVVDGDRQARAHARLEDERVAVEIPDGERLVGGRQGGHHRADDHVVQRGEAAAAQAQDLVVVGGQLVGGGLALGGDAPLVQQLLAAVHAGKGLRVPHVDREQHRRPPRPSYETGFSPASMDSDPLRISTVTSCAV